MIKLPPPPIHSPFFAGTTLQKEGNAICHDWLSWFQLVYAIGKDPGNVGPVGPAGAAGAQGPTGATGAMGPAGSANINGAPEYLIKFNGPTTGANSIAHQESTDCLQIEGTLIKSQSVNNNLTIGAGYTMLAGSLDIAAGVTLTIDIGSELICL
jgi:hypothetical protein